MSEKIINVLAIGLLSLMFIVGLSSYQQDALTMDEQSHIGAGYSYLSQQDFRINPEHPPLIKDLSAVPLLFLDLNFPIDDAAWTDGINNQWIFGNKFIFNSGNDADQIIFWSRLPMLLILISLGWFLFWWIKKEFNKEAALMTLFLFSFSPNLIAHGRLVTTDIGAILGFVLSAYFWLKFLRDPSKKNVLYAGLIFGVSMLLKFSLALLIPFFGVITLTYVLIKKENMMQYLGKSILIGLIGLIFVIWPTYQVHVTNYPIERQVIDTTSMLQPTLMNPLREFLIFIAGIPIIRSIGLYFTGLLMATQRTAFGNTTYFLGKMANSSYRDYFPIVYLLKVPIAFHILTLTALLSLIFKKAEKARLIIKDKIESNFTEFSMLVFLLIYWLTSVLGNLNLGIRHLLPVFPFTYVLVSLCLIKLIKTIKKPTIKKASIFLISFCLAWYATSSLTNYPYYISYFNEIVGTDNGYKYVVDSNYDWGQDFKRLVKWVEENNIEKIKIDYFGGADVNYYLGDKAVWFDSSSGVQKGYLAISTTYLQSGIGEPVPGFNYDAGFYRWLEDYEPIARAGKSILIYYIE